jgi:surface antigen
LARLAALLVTAVLMATGMAAMVVTAPGTAAAASVTLCNGYAACSVAPYSTYGYPSDSQSSYWGMTPGNECTNYAAFVESTVFGAPTPDFALGNADTWATNAAANGITVDSVPTVGSVAEWNAGDFGIGPTGHVAVVEEVTPTYIVVSQQDITTDVDDYDWHQIDRGTPSDAWEPWPDAFIHFVASAPTAPALAAPVVGMASVPGGGGYWLADASGGVSAHGDAVNVGSMAGQPLNAPITHIVATVTGLGYWLVAADGGIFSFGDARFYGSMGGRRLNAPVVDMAPTSDGGGYWLVASDGGVFSFGDASFHGSTGGWHLNRPVVGMAADGATGGYWLVASDGGIFSFGAPFYGSTGSLRLTEPINGMATTPDDHGYWLVASDGGIFTGGDAGFFGSAGALRLNAPVVGMAVDTATAGYWLVASDGGIFSFGAPFLGAD